MTDKTTKVIFLDIDGPMIPGRAYKMPGQTRPIVKTFDPVAVGILNHFCETFGYKIVLHSSWIRLFGGKETHDHCIEQGLLAENFADPAVCDTELHWRYTRVAKYLLEHSEITHYVILDDEPYSDDLTTMVEIPPTLKNHLLLVDFYDGIVGTIIDKLRTGKWDD